MRFRRLSLPRPSNQISQPIWDPRARAPFLVSVEADRTLAGYTWDGERWRLSHPLGEAPGGCQPICAWEPHSQKVIVGHVEDQGLASLVQLRDREGEAWPTIAVPVSVCGLPSAAGGLLVMPGVNEQCATLELGDGAARLVGSLERGPFKLALDEDRGTVHGIDGGRMLRWSGDAWEPMAITGHAPNSDRLAWDSERRQLVGVHKRALMAFDGQNWRDTGVDMGSEWGELIYDQARRCLLAVCGQFSRDTVVLPHGEQQARRLGGEDRIYFERDAQVDGDRVIDTYRGFLYRWQGGRFTRHQLFAESFAPHDLVAWASSPEGVWAVRANGEVWYGAHGTTPAPVTRPLDQLGDRHTAIVWHRDRLLILRAGTRRQSWTLVPGGQPEPAPALKLPKGGHVRLASTPAGVVAGCMDGLFLFSEAEQAWRQLSRLAIRWPCHDAPSGRLFAVGHEEAYVLGLDGLQALAAVPPELQAATVTGGQLLALGQDDTWLLDLPDDGPSLDQVLMAPPRKKARRKQSTES